MRPVNMPARGAPKDASARMACLQVVYPTLSVVKEQSLPASLVRLEKELFPLYLARAKPFPLMGTIVKGQSRAIQPVRFPRCRALSAHRLLSADDAQPKKPVVSSSYPQSAVFAALALYSPSSGVQSSTRIFVQGKARTHPGRDIVASFSRAHGRMSYSASSLPEIVYCCREAFFSILAALLIARYSISAR
jgi:hypothetical protein